ncbi:DUF4138 domain-containing protein [Bacteroides sp.]|uniref:DUF4138 domain-containing protein n=1 Tax=Bacteroides sp. TaxID=29523 RepID=UPI00258E08AB|nr:DUF4138 domain-containing protein [Bacteroides sp.]
MNKKIIVTAFLLAAGLFATRNAQAQRTYEEMERLTVNEQVTTVITATEPVRFVDISTDKVAGDQPIENIIRLKPKETGHEDGEVLAIVTIVTERYRTQYALIYTTRDIDEIRVKLSDKKLSKATNAQTIELTPALVLEHGKTFKHGYRNVIVVKKMTFPNDKLLTIEMTEQQISGRNISLNIDYEDVLSADSFNTALLEEE